MVRTTSLNESAEIISIALVADKAAEPEDGRKSICKSGYQYEDTRMRLWYLPVQSKNYLLTRRVG